MTEIEAERAMAELDRLLNDPEVRMDPARVWALCGSLSGGASAPAAPAAN